MALGTIAAATGLLQPLTQLGVGAWQRNQAKKIKKSEFMPSQLRASLKEDLMSATSNRMVDQGAEAADIENTAAQTRYNTTGNAAKQLAVNSSLSEDTRRKKALLRSRGRQMKNIAKDRLAQTRMAAAGVEAKNEDEYNKSVSALKGAGLQNMATGIGGLGRPVSSILGSIQRNRG